MREIGPYYEALAGKLRKSAPSSLNPIYLELAEVMGSKESKYIPRILAKLATPEQARTAGEMVEASKRMREYIRAQGERKNRRSHIV